MKKTSYVLGAICLVAVLFGVGMATGKGIEVQAEDIVVLGDLNNSAVADKEDAIVLEQHLTGESEITDANVLDAADTNGDGTVNVKDLVRYRRYCTEASTSLTGLGSESAPYLINTLSDLIYLQTSVDGGTNYDKKYIKLCDDIAVNTVDLANESTGELNTGVSGQLIKNWDPIGSSSHKFQGIFSGYDSANQTDAIKQISGIYISSSDAYVGLFSYTASAAAISNLKLTNSYINTSTTSTFVGSVVALTVATGEMTNIYSDAVIKCTSATKCGGLFGTVGGTANRTVSNCMFAGYIHAKNDCGGIAGTVRQPSTKTFTGCSNVGTVVPSISSARVGGLIGCIDRFGSAGGRTMPDVVISQCFEAGILNNDTYSASGALVGGFVDTDTVNSVTVTIDYDFNINNCYATNKSNVDGTNLGIPLVGSYDSTKHTVTAEMYPASHLQGWDGYRLTTLDFTDNGYWTATNDGVPELKIWTTATAQNQIETNGAARADFSWLSESYIEDGKTVYPIDSVEDLYGIELDSRLGVKNGNSNGFGSKILKLTSNIVFNEDIQNPVNQWTPIGSPTQNFVGTFDGDGKTISGLYINLEQDEVGLFGRCHANSTIQNVVLMNSSITGKAYVGSIAGFTMGNVINVYSSATVTASGAECGGIVGRLGGASVDKNISECWFDGELIGASSYCGGIVGRVQLGTKTISNCMNTGTIQSTYAGSNPVYTAGVCGALAAGTSQSATITVSNCVNEGTVIVNDKMEVGGKCAGTVVGNATNVKTSTQTADTITCSGLYTTKYVNDGSWIGNQESYKTSDELNALVETLNSTGTGVWEYDSNTARLELVWYTGSTTTH